VAAGNDNIDAFVPVAKPIDDARALVRNQADRVPSGYYRPMTWRPGHGP
jgi:hypothetical protein